jgi:hypothetical protein
MLMNVWEMIVVNRKATTTKTSILFCHGFLRRATMEIEPRFFMKRDSDQSGASYPTTNTDKVEVILHTGAFSFRPTNVRCHTLFLNHID